ncbi:MAG: ribbon-helix-helix protein, CopG family [Elusimicrobia bacterium]|nr:ribbon-helix-helix protein, CopG family [Elusimicrobiota bacterium]
MPKNEVFATKLPAELKAKIDEVCDRLGMRKNFLIEEAIREKLEDLIDAHDLREAVKEATGFHSWESVKKGAKE